MIFSPMIYAVQCGTPAPLSADRQFPELEVPDLTKSEVKALNKFFARFRKRLRGERVVETCEGKRDVFTRDKKTFVEELDVDEGLSGSYRFHGRLVERKGNIVRVPTYFLKVDNRLEYGQIDSNGSYLPVKILAMNKNELRFLSLFRVVRRAGGSSIFESYYSIVWQGKNLLVETETYINGFFFSEERSQLR